MKTFSDAKRKIGRPPVDSAAVNVRLVRASLDAIDDWIAAQPEPRPSRPEAIRLLVTIGIEATYATVLTLDAQIAKAEEKIARRVPTKQSPKKGMAILRKGLAENDLRKLVEKKNQE
jgi:hypothetical protein